MASLTESGLVDELVLMVHPLVLGEGRRFFDDPPYAKFKVADEITTKTGVMVATYKLTD